MYTFKLTVDKKIASRKTAFKMTQEQNKPRFDIEALKEIVVSLFRNHRFHEKHDPHSELDGFKKEAKKHHNPKVVDMTRETLTREQQEKETFPMNLSVTGENPSTN